jgi:hypothetical protein
LFVAPFVSVIAAVALAQREMRGVGVEDAVVHTVAVQIPGGHSVT